MFDVDGEGLEKMTGQPEMGVDIIIPIYNAYEDLVKCVSSIWRHTDLQRHRLILVNDVSTDARIWPYLQDISGGNILVHNSAQNGGFSASVNIGMQMSGDRDVILLNSDTIVTADWVEKIRQCAYSDDNIATVTPLSNSATLASIPVFGQDNPVPANVSIDGLALLVDRCSFKRYPQITVAVGFCMFIKRKVLNEIGLFDAETFGRGYGEENDFCCRAEIMGYKHVLCDDTFIYHKGTGSFQSEQKKALAEEHARILEERYPKAMRNNHLFCMGKPYQHIRDNIILHLRLHNGRKNILYVLHNDFTNDVSTGVGGTQLHVKDLTYGLRQKYNIFVLAKGQKSFSLTCYMEETCAFEFDDRNVSSYPLFRSRDEENLMKNILTAFRIGLVHIHHIAAMSLEVYYAAKQMGIPVVTSIHDFYMLCPTYFLYDAGGQFCSGHCSEACGECLYAKGGIYGGSKYIAKWREQMRGALALNNMLVFPSESAERVFQTVYQLDLPCLVIEHGTSFEEKETGYVTGEPGLSGMRCNLENIDLVGSNVIEGWALWENRDNKKTGILLQLLQEGEVVQEIKAKKQQRMDVDDAFQGDGKYQFSGFQAHVDKSVLSMEKKLSVRLLLMQNPTAYVVKQIDDVPFQPAVIGDGIRAAFIGGLSGVKGSPIAYEMVQEGTDIEWFLFGDIAPGEKLAGHEAPNWHRFGAYDRDNLLTLLRHYKIDIVCVMSKCSETFCYTLSEAWEAKLPVIGFDIGAVGERIKKTGAGMAMPVSAGAEEIVGKIRGLHTDAAWSDIRKNLEAYENSTVDHMVKEYEGLYERLYTDVKHGRIPDPEMILEAYRQ